MSTVDDVEGSVMAALLRGEYQPGTWVRQDELAGRLGVSKIPVREALHRLAARGLLRFEANRGAIVPVLSADEAEEIYTLRRGIEPLLLRRALPRQTIVELAEAQLALEAGDQGVAEANWAFHRPLYRASGWRRGLATAEILHTAVAPYVALYTDGLEGGPHSTAEHVAILEACRRGDAEAATHLLVEHLDHAQRALVGFLASEVG